MGEIPKYKVVEEVRKTHKALKKLSPEDRKVIENSDVGQIRRLIADKTASPETITDAAHEYYQKHPELIKPLERLEELVKEG